MPLLETAPTLAEHAYPSMKLVPVTVMMLPAYARLGAMLVITGSAVTFNVLAKEAITTELGFVIVISIRDPPNSVMFAITITIFEDEAIMQDDVL